VRAPVRPRNLATAGNASRSTSSADPSYTREVPHVLAGRIETAVAAALEVHRGELAALVERQVEAELERLVDELVLEAIARRNGHRHIPNERQARDADAGEELRRCSTCRRELPLDAFGRDARTADGHRRRCRDCRRRTEYRPRARRAGEKARPAAPLGPRDDEEPTGRTSRRKRQNASQRLGRRRARADDRRMAARRRPRRAQRPRPRRNAARHGDVRRTLRS
jgi:hypothetical protein